MHLFATGLLKYYCSVTNSPKGTRLCEMQQTCDVTLTGPGEHGGPSRWKPWKTNALQRIGKNPCKDWKLIILPRF